MFKKYQWNSEELKKKANNYGYLTLLMAVLALACLYLLPENVKVVNLLFIAIGVTCWWLGQKTQRKDKALKSDKAKKRKINHIDKA